MSTLQEQINALPSGGTLTVSGEFIENIVISKSLTLVGARIVSPGVDPAVFFAPGTKDVTLRNCEITCNAPKIYDLVRIGTWQTTDLAMVPMNITIDQCDIHGNPTQEVQRGIAANGANVQITNCKIHEIHGVGYDSQAICAWNGPGPFKIINNYLEAAGENILFGGADPGIPNLIPSNIEIRGNHLFKPLSWKVGDPSYAGIHWSIKNLLEIKMGRNIVIDNNVLENCWGDAQIGYAVLFTVRNQDGKAPWATIENVQFTNNLIKNCEQGFQLLGSDNLNPSGRASGLLIRNNKFEGIKNRFFTMTIYASVTLEHNTHEQGGNIMTLYGEPSPGFIYRNNVTARNPNGYGIFGDTVGEGKIALDTYAPGNQVEGNVIAGALERFYPVNDFYPADLSNLPSYKGTDGLVPGYTVDAPAPTPAPSPTPVPDPTPVPAPTPAPETRKVAWPKQEGKQTAVLDAQWRERFRCKDTAVSGDFAIFEKVG